MTVISKRFADELSEKEMRDAYLSAQIRTKLTNQIRAIRSLRGWSQGEFAKILGKPQSNVSRLENREYGSFTLNTLFELASAFDVGLVVEFVPYDDFLRRTYDLSPSHLQVPPFSRSALEPLCRTDYQTAAPATIVSTAPMQLESLAHLASASSANPLTGYATQVTLDLNAIGFSGLIQKTDMANPAVALANTTTAASQVPATAPSGTSEVVAFMPQW